MCQRPCGLQLGIPVGGDDEQRRIRAAPTEVLQQEQRRLIRPVQVLQPQQQRGGARCAGDGEYEVGDALEQAVAGLLGIERGAGRQIRQALADLGEQQRHLDRARAELRL